MSNNTVILIPARMQSERFPNKPLADICGKSMILHVLDRANEADIGSVYIACCEQEVFDEVTNNQGNALFTKIDHACGTDRIYEALHKIENSHNIDYVINVQGDLPTIDPDIIRKISEEISKDECDIVTVVSAIKDQEEKTNPNVVKAILSFKENEDAANALYFTRATAPYGDGDLYHHIGIYAYTRKALEKFVNLPASPLEKREKLEQLRALENGMKINALLVDTVPLGVDTPADLEKAKGIISAEK